MDNNETVAKKKLPVKEICLVLVGVIIGIVISYGLFASALIETAKDVDIKTESTTKPVETKAPEANGEGTDTETEEIEGTDTETEEIEEEKAESSEETVKNEE